MNARRSGDVTANHLDVGVGTGYFLVHCTFPTPRPRLALMDLNPACLKAASRRVSRFEPETHIVNVVEPIGPQLDGDVVRFDSIAMTYLLHCLPGDMAMKAALNEHLDDTSIRVVGCVALFAGTARAS